MRLKALELCEELKAGDIVGIVLMSSVAEGNIHPSSDIDICVIHKSPSPIKDYLGPIRKRISRHGFNVDIQRQPLLGLEKTLIYERLDARKRPESARMFSWLRESLIMYDSELRVASLKELADEQTWDKKAVNLKIQEGKIHLAQARKKVAENDSIGAILTYRKCSVDLANAFLMKSNGMPQFTPIWLFSSLTNTAFADLFIESHQLMNRMTLKEIELLVTQLTTWRENHQSST